MANEFKGRTGSGAVRRVAGARNDRSSPLGREYGERAADDLLAAGLTHHRIDLQQMRPLSGGDSRKRELPWALARHTAAKQGWIARRSALGSASHASHLPARYEKQAGTRCQAPEWMS